MEFIEWLLAHHLYSGTVLTLVVCGMGLPVSEEIVFLLAGYACATYHHHVWVLCGFGVLGILMGDSIPYWVGRHYGLRLIKKRPFCWVLSERGVEKTRSFFGKRGAGAVFIGRFIAGARMPIFFMSGSMGVTYPRFLFFDCLGAMLSCPISIWLAYYFGKQAEQYLKESKPVMFTVLGLIVAYLIYHAWHSHHEAAKLEAPAVVLEEAPKIEAVEPVAKVEIN